MSFVQEAQGIQQLLCEDTDKGRTQPSELVLLDEFIEVDAEEFEGKAKVLAVDERVLQAEQVVVVVLVVFAVQLWRLCVRIAANDAIQLTVDLPDPTLRLPSYSG